MGIYSKIVTGDDRMKKVLLCILDGVGLSDKKEGNAFYNSFNNYL